jgi:hypothetical protein
MPSDKRQVLECLDKSTPIDISDEFGFTGISGKKKVEIAAFQSRKGSVRVEESMAPTIRQIVSMAWSSNDSALAVVGDKTLKLIAQELVNSVRKSIAIDWTLRGNGRAQMRVIINSSLRKYDYPPDKQLRATDLVLGQAEVLCHEWI